MTKNDYIECITKMLQKLDINVVKKIFDYVHKKFIRRTGF